MKKKIPADIISKKRTFFAASLSIQKYIICPPAPICCYFKEGGLEAFYTYDLVPASCYLYGVCTICAWGIYTRPDQRSNKSSTTQVLQLYTCRCGCQ